MRSKVGARLRDQTIRKATETLGLPLSPHNPRECAKYRASQRRCYGFRPLCYSFTTPYDWRSDSRKTYALIQAIDRVTSNNHSHLHDEYRVDGVD
jgi:hypothetical protein